MSDTRNIEFYTRLFFNWVMEAQLESDFFGDQHGLEEAEYTLPDELLAPYLDLGLTRDYGDVPF